MRKLFTLFAVLAGMAAHGQSRSISSKISEVTVYRQGATIKRIAHVNLEQGLNEIGLEGVSNHVDANSIRIDGSGDATIISVNYQNNYMSDKTAGPEEKRLQNELDTLQLRLDHIQNEHASLSEELDMLKANEKLPPPGQNAAFVDELEDAADFYRKRVVDTRDMLTQVIKKEKIFSEKVIRLQNQINLIRNKDENPGGQIIITLSASTATAADIEFSYYVSGASWRPVYALRAGKAAESVAMDYNAMVSQTTGENWKDVKLTLSTADPTVNGNAPVLSPMQANPYSPPVIKYSAPAARYKSEDNNTQLDNDNTTTGATMELKQLQAITFQNTASTSFEISVNYTIPSDGIEKSISIQQYTVPAHFSYLTVPKLSSDAFLQAKITGWESYNLLPGEANIFLDNAYSGKSYLNPAGTEDTLNISFGVDKKINIKRTRVKDYSKKQFLGSNRIDEYGYEISIRNTKTTPIDIRIEDQIPVSTNKEVTVDLKESSGGKLDPVTGKLSWDMNLNAGEDKKVSFNYTVKHPKDMVMQNVY